MIALRKRHRARQSGQVLVLLIIVVAILGGGAWWLYRTKAESEKAVRAFAREVVTRLAFQHDRKFLDSHFDRETQVHYPPSYRDRLVQNLRELGTPNPQFELDGSVTFTSEFFAPRGSFRVRLDYPGRDPAYLDVGVSNPNVWWQIDFINLTWHTASSVAAPPDPYSAVPPAPSPTP